MRSDKEIHKNAKNNPDANPDPITGQPGAHPVGTGVGAAGAGVVGTAIGGVVGGPVGAVVGAAVGAVAGGLVGKNTAEKIDPTIEDSYWRTNYKSRPYATTDHTYDDYSPAYRTGYEGYGNYSQQGLTYDQAEPRLKEDYERQYSGHRLGWDSARHASRDAWDRVDRNNTRYRAEDDYWRSNFSSRPYREADYTYDDYSPAYRTGYEGYSTYADQGLTFSQAEPHLRRDYERRNANGRLGWEKAKHAIQDAWHRLESAVTHDSADYRDSRDRRVDPSYDINANRSSYDRSIDGTPRPDSGTANLL
ncbi:glycine zipper family protein [Nodosilinea sp. PGN35]|uniref:glycine zipper family protein n=1 Tax=Nodosilinea sp. PGN35 TaxID=3020489 RepID=UPI0023B2C731|nr:glycine zipper family protein [Nodosilinea sp. TSF1-S3]MDF0365585.1 glycine zipper family protein [Nodosilinea sp. TSF1-S3]